ncbi:hypothetical protein, partial [Pseudomonas silesiensis]|uniref:hypothetical protein n=1 Tax=Pseudomonas silesiensis TaxID=1853130 RepID=UPI0034D4D8BA
MMRAEQFINEENALADHPHCHVALRMRLVKKLLLLHFQQTYQHIWFQNIRGLHSLFSPEFAALFRNTQSYTLL